ncbi:MAG: globin domain-containing protein [Ferruginibacter sp.]
MTTNTIDLVKNSWALIAKIDMETVGGLFYNKLFEIAPEVKPMFSRSAMPEQSKKLLGMLSYVISKLDRLDEILDEVKKLAQRHNAYGVKGAHYTAVGTALLWTLEQGLDTYWNNEMKVAWTEVYTVLSGAMISFSQTELAG